VKVKGMCVLLLAHFRYVLSMGAVFALFAGFYYWVGKIFGRTYPETLGQIHFLITIQHLFIF
jgi:cytochrome c oxidase subunit 1